MTKTVVGGGTNSTLTEAEQQAQNRRVGIQTYVNEHLDRPDDIILAMMMFGVGFAEVKAAMDGTVNMTHYLRRAGVADGFGGLKVWPAATVQRYLDYVQRTAATQGWGLPGVVDPIEAQDVLDWAERMKAARPSFVAPWESV